MGICYDVIGEIFSFIGDSKDVQSLLLVSSEVKELIEGVLPHRFHNTVYAPSSRFGDRFIKKVSFQKKSYVHNLVLDEDEINDDFKMLWCKYFDLRAITFRNFSSKISVNPYVAKKYLSKCVQLSIIDSDNKSIGAAIRVFKKALRSLNVQGLEKRGYSAFANIYGGRTRSRIRYPSSKLNFKVFCKSLKTSLESIYFSHLFILPDTSPQARRNSSSSTQSTKATSESQSQQFLDFSDFPNLKKLHFNDVVGECHSSQLTLRLPPSVQDIKFERTKILIDWKSLASTECLERIYLGYNNDFVPADFFKFLERKDKVKSIKLWLQSWNVHDMMKSFWKMEFPRLQTLYFFADMTDIDIQPPLLLQPIEKETLKQSDDGDEKLNSPISNVNLEQDFCSGGDLYVNEKFYRVKTLKFGGMNWRREKLCGVLGILNLRKFKGLKKLGIKSTDLKDADLRIPSLLNGLESLEVLSNEHICDVITEFRRLKCLCATSVRILYEAEKVPTLRILKLRGVSITRCSRTMTYLAKAMKQVTRVVTENLPEARFVGRTGGKRKIKILKCLDDIRRNGKIVLFHGCNTRSKYS